MSVAEIEVMESGVFVFISMLVVRGQIIDRWSDYRPDLVPRELGSILVFRKVYKFESTAQMRDIVRISRWPNAILPMVPSDGYVQVHRGFDYRFKEVQTVDLDVDEGTGRDRHGTDMVRNLSRLIPQGINENEFAVNKDLTLTWIRSRADEKLHADSTEVIDSILSCAVGDPVSRSLLDLEALSFEMRRMVYDAANTALALSRTRTIVSVGTGRFQEWREMDFKNNLYICVDPELDTSILRGVKIIEPDLDNLIPVIRRTANKQTGVIAVQDVHGHVHQRVCLWSGMAFPNSVVPNVIGETTSILEGAVRIERTGEGQITTHVGLDSFDEVLVKIEELMDSDPNIVWGDAVLDKADGVYERELGNIMFLRT
eukprot:gene24312-9917_t